MTGPNASEETKVSYPHFSTDCDEHHGLVRDFGGPRPEIVVLCGSTRFGAAFRQANFDLTLAGHIVLSIGCDTKSDDDLWSDPVKAAKLKVELDDLHKRKIDLADRVLVLDVDGYVGESTRSEIQYAEKLGRPVSYLSSGDLGWVAA